MKRALILAIMTWLCASVGAQELPHSAPLLHFHVIREYPHRTDAYTEGLVFSNGELYESTGRVGHSSLRRVDLASGDVQQQVLIPAPYFAEGLARIGKRWLQLTWKSGQGFIYDEQLRRTGEFRYAGEGWGLTFDGEHAVMSDGSAWLHLLDPNDLHVLDRLPVFDGEQPVTSLNELEYANGHIYANVWLTDDVAVIDGHSGDVAGWLDLSSLRERFTPPPGWDRGNDVLNGIAYDPGKRHFFVTGKCWPKLFEIAIDSDRDGSTARASAATTASPHEQR